MSRLPHPDAFLFGRERELRFIEEQLDSVSDRGSALLIRGDNRSSLTWRIESKRGQPSAISPRLVTLLCEAPLAARRSPGAQYSLRVGVSPKILLGGVASITPKTPGAVIM